MKNKGITCLASFIGGGLLAYGIMKKKNKKDLFLAWKKTEKFRNYYEMLGQWISLKNSGNKIDQYFVDNNIKDIAIYGMGNVGMYLYEELKNSLVNVKYCIDKGSDMLSWENISIKKPEDGLPLVDAIVVTACFDYEAIKKELEQYVDFTILPLDEILFS